MRCLISSKKLHICWFALVVWRRRRHHHQVSTSAADAAPREVTPPLGRLFRDTHLFLYTSPFSGVGVTVIPLLCYLALSIHRKYDRVKNVIF